MLLSFHLLPVPPAPHQKMKAPFERPGEANLLDLINYFSGALTSQVFASDNKFIGLKSHDTVPLSHLV